MWYASHPIRLIRRLNLEESPAGDLYLERLEFVQQLFELEEISPVLHRLRMEVDFIRLIEEKQQEN